MSISRLYSSHSDKVLPALRARGFLMRGAGLIRRRTKIVSTSFRFVQEIVIAQTSLRPFNIRSERAQGAFRSWQRMFVAP